MDNMDVNEQDWWSTMQLGQDEFRALQRSADMRTAEQESAPQTPTYVLQEACPDDDFPQEACPDEALIFPMQHVSQQTGLSKTMAMPPPGVQSVVKKCPEPNRTGRKSNGKLFSAMTYDERFASWLEQFKEALQAGDMQPGWAIRFQAEGPREHCKLDEESGLDADEQMKYALKVYGKEKFGFVSSLKEARQDGFRWSNEPTKNKYGKVRSRAIDLHVKEVNDILSEITGKGDNRNLKKLLGAALCCLGLRADVGIPHGDNTTGTPQVTTDAYLIHLAKAVATRPKPTGH